MTAESLIDSIAERVYNDRHTGTWAELIAADKDHSKIQKYRNVANSALLAMQEQRCEISYNTKRLVKIGQFIYDRMIHVHGENENVGYMHDLRDVIKYLSAPMLVSKGMPAQTPFSSDNNATENGLSMGCSKSVSASARPAQPVQSALEKAAEILANFKGEPHSSKLEEWQACYAMLFTQMNDLVNAPKRESGWQPIETAPKDSEHGIMARHGYAVFWTNWDGVDEVWFTQNRYYEDSRYAKTHGGTEWKPTHWMSLNQIEVQETQNE